MRPQRCSKTTPTAREKTAFYTKLARRLSQLVQLRANDDAHGLVEAAHHGEALLVRVPEGGCIVLYAVEATGCVEKVFFCSSSTVPWLESSSAQNNPPRRGIGQRLT